MIIKGPLLYDQKAGSFAFDCKAACLNLFNVFDLFNCMKVKSGPKKLFRAINRIFLDLPNAAFDKSLKLSNSFSSLTDLSSKLFESKVSATDLCD